MESAEGNFVREKGKWERRKTAMRDSESKGIKGREKKEKMAREKKRREKGEKKVE